MYVFDTESLKTAINVLESDNYLSDFKTIITAFIVVVIQKD